MIYYIIIFVCIYTTIDSIFLYSFIFFVIFIFVVNVLVQLCIILVRNGMFYKKKTKIIKFGDYFLLCNRYRVYLLMKKN